MKITDKESKNIIKIAAIIIAIYWISQNLVYAGDVLNFVMNVSSPIIIGGAMAFVLNLPMKSFERLIRKLDKKHRLKKSVRPIALSLSIVALIGFIAWLLQIVVPEIVNAFSMLATTIPDGFDNFVNWIQKYDEIFPQIGEWLKQIQPDWVSIAQNAMNFATSGLVEVFDTTFSVITIISSGVFNFFMAVILAIYMVMSKEKLIKQIKRFMKAYAPEKIYINAIRIGSVANEAFSSFIAGKCIDAVIVGMMCTGGMLLLRLPYAAMIGVIIGVTALIPIIGGYIGVAIGGFLILMINPMQALEFVIFFFIVQTFEGNVIYPKIMGSKVGLPPMWVLVAIIIGGALFGFIGILISVPVFSTIYTLVGESVERRLNKTDSRIDKDLI